MLEVLPGCLYVSVRARSHSGVFLHTLQKVPCCSDLSKVILKIISRVLCVFYAFHTVKAILFLYVLAVYRASVSLDPKRKTADGSFQEHNLPHMPSPDEGASTAKSPLGCQKPVTKRLTFV